MRDACWLVVVLFLSLSTVQPSVAGGDLPDGWFKGQTHTHSEHSPDGNHPIALIADWYQEHGYDFVVLSDHGRMTRWGHLSTPDFLALDGEELSCCRNHVNGIAHDHGVPGHGRSIEDNLRRIHELGGVAHLNHPTGMFGLQLGDLMQAGPMLEIMEIWNGIWVQGGRDVVLWDRLLSSGKRVFGIGTDDMHRLSLHGDKAWIVVRAAELSQEAILDAIVRGEMYASTGVVLEDYRVEDGRMTVESRTGTSVRFIGRGGIVLHEVAGPDGEYEFKGHEGYVRAEVVQGDPELERAWTQPVFVGTYRQGLFAQQLVDSSFPQGERRVFQALGRPHDGPLSEDPGEHHATRLAPGSWIELDLGADSPLVDREGPDLFVEELDEEDGFDGADRYRVSVMAPAPNREWIELGEAAGDADFDLAGRVPAARFVRIEASGDDEVEIDGVRANAIDPFADRVLDADGVVGGHVGYAVGPPSIGAFDDRDLLEYVAEIESAGALTLDLGAGEEAVDDVGEDFYVSEVGPGDGSYRVSASRDGVHWTEIADATGSASFDLAGRLPWTRYVRIEPIDANALLDGVWVHHLGADSDVEVTLELDRETIPAEGGPLDYTMRLENRSEEVVTGFLWVTAIAADGGDAGPFFEPRAVTVSPGQIRERTLSIEVPAGAPAGRHLMVASWGTHPASTVDVDVRSFVKE